MMRAGQLDRVILIQRETTTLDLYGVPAKVWTTFATMRAQMLVPLAIDDRESSRGHVTDTSVTFRTRWIVGIGLEHRIAYDGQVFTIRQIKEIGRRVGLDVLCERVGL